ncbi:hypothetical protein BD560DRAFT_381418 [Blakeslea trispora]|nr:hypothetical protein BD560DRAFT_381418 [Blakeslea trispora]
MKVRGVLLLNQLEHMYKKAVMNIRRMSKYSFSALSSNIARVIGLTFYFLLCE